MQDLQQDSALLQKSIECLPKKGIEPATTEWAAPVVFAHIKDGSLRFCMDYRKLDTVKARDLYPVSRVYEGVNILER